MANNSNNITIEDVTIAFRNFAGKEDQYNRAGDRNFAILLDGQAEQLFLDGGWNVKYLKEREEGDGRQAYIQVALSYKVRPPKIGMVTSKGITYLGQDEVEILDWVDIETADVTLNPYDWAVGDKSGRKAYVQTLMVKIQEDYLQEKWTKWVDDQKAIGPSQREIVEGEYEVV